MYKPESVLGYDKDQILCDFVIQTDYLIPVWIKEN